jgi:copper ion binding protein
MKTIVHKKLRYIASFVLIPLLITLLGLVSCSQQRDKEQAKDIAANEKVKTVTIPVEGMTCGACVSRVKKSLRSLDGVTEISVSLENRDATVHYLSDKTSLEQILKAIDDLGYKAGTPKQE